MSDDNVNVPRPGLYPGLGLPLRYWPDQGSRAPTAVYPIASHDNFWGSNSVMVQVREVAMLMVMDRLTDKPDWHVKVFNDEIVAKWRAEALVIPDALLWKVACSPGSQWDRESFGTEDDEDGNPPRGYKDPSVVQGIMSEAAFDYCISELRSKAEYFKETGLVQTLDVSATVVKSDVLIKDDLRKELVSAFDRLQKDQASHPDWHPGTDEKVQNLVHPSMYPLIYGRSRVLKDEVVGVADAVEKWAGKGDVIDKDTASIPVSFRHNHGGSDIPYEYWSNDYQWLPANVAFQKDGGVKFTSYINNLHPNKYPEIYSTIEKLIDAAIPAWDQCLASNEFEENGAAKREPRLGLPDGADDDIGDNWNPSDKAAVEDIEVDFSKDHEYDWVDEEDRRKWLILRKPVLRDPGDYEAINYKPEETIREKFAEFGLQVIVKMASIELTPEKPDFPAGGWHIEGQMNERICGTALYYLDSENITESRLSFRMQTSYEQEDLQDGVGQDSYHWLECLYGTTLGGGWAPCIQNYGSVETREGRLLAFPNVFQHRVSPFKLADPTKPGRRRFIALWLVDPHLRVLSTANVPPQQQEWWSESVFGSSEGSQEKAAGKMPAEMLLLMREKGFAPAGKAQGLNPKLPQELMNMVRSSFEGAMPMSEDEAREHRKKLMEERSRVAEASEKDWADMTYSFCEH